MGDNDALPVTIAVCLSREQEEAHLGVLKAHKKAIGWTIADIKGINPLVVDAQRRLNPAMKEVVKELMKWLDVRIIFPIFDSEWTKCLTDWRQRNTIISLMDIRDIIKILFIQMIRKNVHLHAHLDYATLQLRLCYV
ncbi:Retrotransposon gag protein [Gossypium australe]|uniref:Retrotransposon gag protein n=1 Tax=Gossypium australe TaxID=47621 RepID=A0A5B6WV11_9ROSI|nr:Retrotransposon gag protein [Gossypium australe]